MLPLRLQMQIVALNTGITSFVFRLVGVGVLFSESVLIEGA